MRIPSLICALAFSMSAGAQMCADAACFGPRHVILTGTLVLNGPASISAA